MPTNIYHNQELTTNQLKWKVHYERLCYRGQERASSKKEANLILGYSEQHHIIPRCMDGQHIFSNLTYLSAREHFVAHQLLVKIFPGYKGLALACHMMCVNKNGNRINNKMYAWLKQIVSSEQSKIMKGFTKETSPRIAKIAATLSGRTIFNNEDVLKAARTRRKLDFEQRKLLVQMKEFGMTNTMVQNYFSITYNINLAYQTISNLAWFFRKNSIEDYKNL